MSAAPVLMTAQRGGEPRPAPTPLTVTKAPRALHIAPEILAQPGLSLTACALLAEVLDLYRAKGKVFANNAHFAERCRCSERTVRSTITELEDGGYLERGGQEKCSSKRLLVPTDKWQTPPGDPAEFAGSVPGDPANSAEAPGENCQVTRQILPGHPANSATINTKLNTKGNFKLTPPRAGAGPEKKIEKARPPEEATPLAAPQRPAAHTGGGAAGPAAPAPDLPHLAPPPEPGEPAGFADLWQCWPKQEKRPAALRAFRALSADEQAAAASRADAWLTARPDLPHRENGRYLPQLANWLSEKRWTDANPQPATPPLHATQHPTSYPPQRPVNGHKPAGNGGELARLLAESD